MVIVCITCRNKVEIFRFIILYTKLQIPTLFRILLCTKHFAFGVLECGAESEDLEEYYRRYDLRVSCGIPPARFGDRYCD